MIFPRNLKPKPKPGDTRTYAAIAWLPNVCFIPGRGLCTVWLERILITETLIRRPTGLAIFQEEDVWVETYVCLAPAK